MLQTFNPLQKKLLGAIYSMAGNVGSETQHLRITLQYGLEMKQKKMQSNAFWSEKRRKALKLPRLKGRWRYELCRMLTSRCMMSSFQMMNGSSSLKILPRAPEKCLCIAEFLLPGWLLVWLQALLKLQWHTAKNEFNSRNR